MSFQIGDVVFWDNSRGILRGKILRVVQAGTLPDIPSGYKKHAGCWMGPGVSNRTGGSKGLKRHHDSYLVAVDRDVYWPNVCDLHRVDEAKELAEALSKYVNGIGNKVEDVVEHLAMEHRTLQQGVTKFCVAWLERCARKHQEKDFDLRNEASAELGKKFVERMTPQERAMPFI